MPAYRDHPRRGAALVAHVVYIAAGSLVGGSIVAFLLIVIAAIVGEEAFGVPYDDALDPIFRVSVGVVALVLALGAGVATASLGARRLETARQLADDAERDPGSVATWADRQDIEVATPFWPFYIYAIYFMIFDVLALIVFAFALPETFRHNPVSAAEAMPIVMVVATLGLLVVLLVVYSRKVAMPQWRDAADRAKAIWNKHVRADATRAERDARADSETAEFGAAHRILSRAGKWIGLGAVPIGGIGIALFFIGVWLRKPCRRCEMRYFDPPIESFIDVVIVIGGPLIWLSLALGILGLAAEWISRVIETLTLRRLAAAGAPSPTAAQLVPHLVGQGPAELLGIALVAGSLPLIAPFAVARAINGDPAFGTVVGILVAVGLLGVGVITWSVGVDDGVRNRLREAWSPGDPVPPKPDARRRTAPTRDAGDQLDADDDDVDER